MSYVPSTEGWYKIRATHFKCGSFLQLVADGSRVAMTDLDKDSDYQKWHVIPVKNKPNTYKITSFNDAFTLSWGSGGSLDPAGKGYLIGKTTSSTEWTLFIKNSNYYPKITTSEKPNFSVNGSNIRTVPLKEDDEESAYQYWAFERVMQPTGPIVAQTGPISAQRFQNRFFKLTAGEAAVQTKGEEYDIIIVGSGIGGGVLANDLYDTNFKLGKKGKRILLLEKGGLTFHTHCLNTARPAGLTKDRGQQNDTFFANFKSEFTFSHEMDDWKGGPMYNVGGRSAAWGLFAPRVHDRTLENHFHEDVVRELHEQFYDKAERLMKLSLPQTKRIHQHVMDRLNMEGLQSEPHSGVQWQWGRIASEFRDEKNFDFAEGAYSTIDKLLEIAMSKPKKDVNGESKEVELENFKMVVGAEVRSLIINRTAKTPIVEGVNVKTFDGKSIPIKVKAGGNVILCAGSVDSPAILLRSGANYKPERGRDWAAQIKYKGGLKITDHDILYYSRSFRFRNPQDRAKYGAMKLQTYVDLGGEVVALANMSIDASSFLPRGEAPDEELPKFIMVFILQTKLADGNNISIDPSTDEPVITMGRGESATTTQSHRMKNLTASAMESLKSTLGIDFVGFDRPLKYSDIRLSKLELGAVAHELGSLPMANPNSASCLDENLALDPSLCSGVYVCDLSVFPYSPEANPTLTLAALAIRLSRKLNERLHIHKTPLHDVHVVNHSGSKVEVWLSNAAFPGQAESARVHLEPGEDKNWSRKYGVSESLFVYKLDRSKTDGTFLEEPALILAQPGKVTPII